MKNLFIYALFLVSILGFSQAEASHWYFGEGAGLIFDLSTDTVSATTDAENTINTSEGCSSIADFNGNLLFYTDGRNVWDKNHNIMPNANYPANGLLGDPSSTSSGLIVPKPGNPDQYYVFTVDEPHHQNAFAFPNQGPADQSGNSLPNYTFSGGGNAGAVPEADDGFNNGLAYSLVDLSLNGGNGDVVPSEKNRQLITYDPTDQGQASYKCSEKITAVEHADGASYWVLTHFIDKFYAFRIDNSGVNTSPQETQIAPLINYTGYRRNGIGYLKASPDGTKIAVAHRQNGNTEGQTANATGSVWIYDFDNSSGTLSNPSNLLPDSGPYGLEFSPDSSKLYVSNDSSVIQFDLFSPSPSNSLAYIHTNPFNPVQNRVPFIGALQLGPDGRIYIANTDDYNSLDVINEPNEVGVNSDYVQNGLALAPGTSAVIGLPPFIQSFFLASIVFENSCVDDDIQFSVNTTQNYDSISWDFGDGLGVSNLDNPSYTYTNLGTYTVSAEITIGTEVNTFSETIIITSNPIANFVTDINECDDDNDGILSFDFTVPQAQVFGAQLPTDFTVSYHLSQDDADANSAALSLPYQNTDSTEEIFIRIENNANANCFDTTSFTLNVFDTPIANIVGTVEECDDLDDGDDANGQKEIDLTAFDSDVLDTQDATLFSVSYHLSQAEADANTGALSSPYYNTTAFSYQVFTRIENNLKTDCYDTTEFTVNIYAAPKANLVSDLFECDDDNDGILSFDFTVPQAQVFGAQLPTDFTVSYHLSQDDADANSAALSLPYQNTDSTEEIFIRIENNANANCFDTTSFTLNVFDTPIANIVGTVEECDDLDDGDDANGQKEIDLTAFDSDVLDTQDATLFSVSYHLSQAEADANTGALSSPYYNTTAFSYQVFTRIENNLKTDCYDTTEFTVNINPIPTASNTNLIQCDEDGVNDGLTVFNLDEANDALTNGVPNRSTKFYLTAVDAENSTASIDAAPFTNTTNPQTIYAQVIDEDTECFSIAELSLNVSLTSGQDASLFTCDDDGIEDGFKAFTLSNATSSILTGLPADYALIYYETYEDALVEQNALPNIFTNNEAYNQTIYARIENNNQCYGINELELSVFNLPQLDFGDQTFFCIDSNSDPVVIDSGIIGNPSDYTYLWSNGELTNEIEINQGGTYTVVVTNANGCSQTKSITIVNSNIATINEIEVSDVSTNNTITVFATGEGDYEYALDDELGPYQDDSIFYNVSPGFHTVYVRDKNNCGIANEVVSVIGFPNFFTPNNDGYNDSWHVFGINTPSQSNSEIFIFDRYGKLLKQLSYDSLGWDGTYNGNLMPTSDYWFYIKLSDNRIFRGHFTLKR